MHHPAIIGGAVYPKHTLVNVREEAHARGETVVVPGWYYGIRSGTEAKALKDGLGRTEMTGQTTQAQAR